MLYVVRITYVIVITKNIWIFCDKIIFHYFIQTQHNFKTWIISTQPRRKKNRDEYSRHLHLMAGLRPPPVPVVILKKGKKKVRKWWCQHNTVDKQTVSQKNGSIIWYRAKFNCTKKMDELFGTGQSSIVSNKWMDYLYNLVTDCFKFCSVLGNLII